MQRTSGAPVPKQNAVPSSKTASTSASAVQPSFSAGEEAFRSAPFSTTAALQKGKISNTFTIFSRTAAIFSSSEATKFVSASAPAPPTCSLERFFPLFAEITKGLFAASTLPLIKKVKSAAAAKSALCPYTSPATMANCGTMPCRRDALESTAAKPSSTFTPSPICTPRLSSTYMIGVEFFSASCRHRNNFWQFAWLTPPLNTAPFCAAI